MKSLSLYHALAVDELPLSLKIEASDLEVRMGFRHSGISIIMIYLLIRKISFPLMTLVMVQYLLVLVSALHSFGIKQLFLYLIHTVVIEMVTIFPMANQFS